MIRPHRARSASFLAGLQPDRIQPAIVTVTRGLARDEIVGANPEFCQGFQITLVSA